jgi:hypothetical protein
MQKISLLSGVSYPERGYDLFLTAAVADGAKLWDLRQDRNLTRLSQLPVLLCIFEYWYWIQFNSWIMNYKDPKAKCCHLKKFTCKWTLWQVFIRVYRLEIHSVMLEFSTQLCELLPF